MQLQFFILIFVFLLLQFIFIIFVPGPSVVMSLFSYVYGPLKQQTQTIAFKGETAALKTNQPHNNRHQLHLLTIITVVFMIKTISLIGSCD